MKSGKIAVFAMLSSLCLFATKEALARPAAPGEAPLPLLEKLPDLLADFSLYVDSDPANKVIYYIPKVGYVSVDGAFGNEPRPRLSVNQRLIERGYFAGETLTYVGGSMSTNGARGPLNMLYDAATRAGYTIEPAPIEEVTTNFSVVSKSLVIDADGRIRLDVHCEKKAIGTNTMGKTIYTDECFTKSEPDSTYDLGVEMMYRFQALSYRGSTIGGRIPFQGIVLPGWEMLIEDKLLTGDSWDNLIRTDVEWTLEGERRTHKAVLNIDWQALFQQVSAFVAMHIGGCVDAEVEMFFQKIAVCEDTAKKCGISVEWYDANGERTSRPSSNAAFVSAVKELQKELQNELFAQISPDSSVLGRVRRDTRAFFTARGNYEKRFYTRNERREIYYNPGAATLTATTELTIDCVTGSSGSRLSWDTKKAYCRDLLQIASSQ